LVTAFSDALLPTLKSHVEEDCLVEVVPFGSLVRRCLTISGEEALPIAEAAHFEAAVAHACRLLPDDSPYRRTARFPGLHKALTRTLKELRDWGIDGDEMARLQAEASPRLAQKLESLAAVDRESQHVLGLLGRQIHATHLQACLDATPERDGSFDRLLVFMGAEVHPLRLRWLRWIAESGVGVTVVVDRHAVGAEVFKGAQRSLNQLSEMPLEIGEANRLLKNLFSGGGHEGVPVDVAITSASDPLAEVEWALRGCLEEERPDRVGVYVRDLESYAPLIESAARRLGVPIVMARREPLLANAFARLTLTALEFCASQDVRSLGPIVHSSYLGLSCEGQTKLASGLREAHGSRGMQWQTLRTWAEINEEEYPWLLNLLKWRQEVIATPVNAADWCGRLVGLIHELPWHLTEKPNTLSQKRDSHAQSALQRVLAAHASIDRITEGASLPLPQFVDLCRRLWSAADVSVPRADFGVCVTSNAEALGDVDQLFVLGMLEGVFPRRRSEDPILTDDERDEISSLRPGEPEMTTSHDVAAAERDEFYRVCASARKRLVFSYPQADDQRDNVPAFYLAAVEEAAGAVDKRDYPRSLLAPKMESCLMEADRRLREALDGPRETPSPVEIASERAKAALRPAEDQRFTPGQLRDALQCPFQYVSRHRLRLRPKRSTTRWASLRSLPQASGLVGQGSAAQAEKALFEALESQLDTLYSEVPEWEMQLLRAGGQRLIREWVRREFRARETWPKDSVRSSVGFGTHNLRDTMPGGVKLDGVVPAVSSLDRYSVTHLYGSGVKDTSELSDTEKLYYGLYFLAMHEPGREGALEIEGMGGKRALLLLTRGASRPLASRVQEGLHVVDLSTSDDPVLSKKLFFDEVKRSLATAMVRIRESRIDAIKGDHCEWCDYGELCRRSKSFGEEDSPFGLDSVFEE
jgi:ATP-dependent helicase/nuclease subunit B